MVLRIAKFHNILIDLNIKKNEQTILYTLFIDNEDIFINFEIFHLIEVLRFFVSNKLKKGKKYKITGEEANITFEIKRKNDEMYLCMEIKKKLHSATYFFDKIEANTLAKAIDFAIMKTYRVKVQEEEIF